MLNESYAQKADQLLYVWPPYVILLLFRRYYFCQISIQILLKPCRMKRAVVAFMEVTFHRLPNALPLMVHFSPRCVVRVVCKSVTIH